MKFTADKDGSVLGIRFYKAAGNTGTHAVHLWTAGGQLLAGEFATTETASGWQNIMFSSPALISAGTTYIASYYAPNGQYSVTPNGLATGIDNPPLHALGNNVSADGVYSYGPNATFPNSTFNASSYGVDVIYAATPAPGQVTGVTATAGQGNANVSWSAPATGGPASTYVVTPFVGGTAQTPTTVTGSPAATSVTVRSLTAGTTYTFKVQASNTNGTGPVSAASTAVTPTAVATPAAPTNVQAIPATRQAIVSWTAPSDGGNAITGYTITPYIGSTAQTPTQVINASATSAPVTGLTNGTSYTFTVAAINNIGTGAASAASTTIAPEDTIFDGSGPTTAASDSGDTSPVNLGVAFKSDTSGQVLGIRFYKAAANTGSHVGALWSSTGALLASGTFTNETASGWQTLLFSSPVAITAGTTYVASYFAPNGHYSASGNGLAASVDNAPLHAIANGAVANGVYAYGPVSAFPNSTFNATNYWVDVLVATP